MLQIQPLQPLFAARVTGLELRRRVGKAEFARIRKGAEATVVLPDQSEVTGQVRTIGVRNTANKAEVTVEVVSDELLDQAGTELALPGTPVTASVELHDDGPLAGVDRTFRQFLRQVGL